MINTTKLFCVLLALAGAASVAQAQDAAAGQKKAAMCMGCHGIPGYQASFPEIHRVPMLAGQGSKYLVAALTAYKKGDRKHPSMRALAASLSEQDMADLAAFYEKSGQSSLKSVAETTAAAAPADASALVAKGNCASCHGANFSKPIDPSYPKLAGQYPDYLYVALKAYQTDGNPQVGRSNPVMTAMAKQFKPAELKAIAAYLGALPGELQPARQSPFR